MPMLADQMFFLEYSSMTEANEPDIKTLLEGVMNNDEVEQLFAAANKDRYQQDIYKILLALETVNDDVFKSKRFYPQVWERYVGATINSIVFGVDEDAWEEDATGGWSYFTKDKDWVVSVWSDDLDHSGNCVNAQVYSAAGRSAWCSATRRSPNDSNPRLGISFCNPGKDLTDQNAYFMQLAEILAEALVVTGTKPLAFESIQIL